MGWEKGTWVVLGSSSTFTVRETSNRELRMQRSISHFATFYMLLICIIDFLINTDKINQIVDCYFKIVEYVK